MVRMTSIEKINILLAQHGMSGADLERAIGVSNSVYSQWNTGATKPSRKNLKKIADYFQIDVTELLDDPPIKQEVEQSFSPEELVHNAILSTNKKIPDTVSDAEVLEDPCCVE